MIIVNTKTKRMRVGASAGNEAATYNDGPPGVASFLRREPVDEATPGACVNIDSPIPGLFLAPYQGLGMRQP